MNTTNGLDIGLLTAYSLWVTRKMDNITLPGGQIVSNGKTAKMNITEASMEEEDAETKTRPSKHHDTYGQALESIKIPGVTSFNVTTDSMTSDMVRELMSKGTAIKQNSVDDDFEYTTTVYHGNYVNLNQINVTNLTAEIANPTPNFLTQHGLRFEQSGATNVAVVAVDGTGVDTAMSVAGAMVGTVYEITITLGTDDAGVLDDTKNTATLIKAAFDLAISGHATCSIVEGGGSTIMMAFTKTTLSGGLLVNAISIANFTTQLAEGMLLLRDDYVMPDGVEYLIVKFTGRTTREASVKYNAGIETMISVSAKFYGVNRVNKRPQMIVIPSAKLEISGDSIELVSDDFSTLELKITPETMGGQASYFYEYY